MLPSAESVHYFVVDLTHQSMKYTAYVYSQKIDVSAFYCCSYQPSFKPYEKKIKFYLSRTSKIASKIRKSAFRIICPPFSRFSSIVLRRSQPSEWLISASPKLSTNDARVQRYQSRGAHRKPSPNKILLLFEHHFQELAIN